LDFALGRGFVFAADFFAGADLDEVGFAADLLGDDVFFADLVAVFLERAGAIDHSVWTIRCG
jgi:hypothetical protein